MNILPLHYWNFALCALFSAALALSAVLHRASRGQVFKLSSIYFAVLLIAELQARDLEINGVIHLLMNRLFSAPGLPTTLCYCVSAVLLLELVQLYCGSKNQAGVWICIAFFPLWFFNMMLLKSSSPLVEWLYILPYQIFTLSLSVYGLKKEKRMDETSVNRSVTRLLWITAIFSVLIVVEDTVCVLKPELKNLDGDIFIIRNISENVLQAIYAVTAIREFSALLIKRCKAEEGGRSTDAPPEKAGAYASAIGLSTRERDVFMLLLEGKSNQEISQTMNISLGTAKAHTHNIFQKSETENRTELRAAFDRFVSVQTAPKM